jgi:hypothetical protein
VWFAHLVVARLAAGGTSGDLASLVAFMPDYAQIAHTAVETVSACAPILGAHSCADAYGHRRRMSTNGRTSVQYGAKSSEPSAKQYI